LASIIIYGYANYYSLRKATLIIGKERLRVINKQLNASFSQSVQSVITNSNGLAAQSSVTRFLKSGDRASRDETLAILDKLHRDSTWVLIELLDANKNPVLRSNKSTIEIKISRIQALSVKKDADDVGRVGKMFRQNSAVYYPVISPVIEKKQIVGYLLSWQSLLVGSKAVAQFSQLVGMASTVYIGNSDGSLWTDLIKPLPHSPFNMAKNGELIEYKDIEKGDMMAMAQAIPGTNWLLVIAFSEKSVLTGLNSFLNWIVIAGVILTTIGIFAAWMMSRSITRPLSILTEATTAISHGNYSSYVISDIYRSYELRKLAHAFNLMTSEINLMHHNLENKVEERTVQLENVNKELEAFSYSVSHDLRTPLRAINGYSVMLSEDYEARLDDNGKRMLRNIITNATMMGQLIDDLLSFSKLGKKELARTPVDMYLLAKNVVDELLQQEPENKYKVTIEALPPAEADHVMIKQVLTNLIGNALKYSSKITAPEIKIGFRDDGTSTVYYVKDNGAGFNMAYADKLFGVFQRLHLQEDFEGSGVGLALVKRIILKHNGEIWPEAAENAGATFYFRLPKYPNNDQR
jgi:signal transduction histidine kinase